MLIGDEALRGPAFGRALADAVDRALEEAFGLLEQDESVALVALGSYGRRELCPGSDIDVLLVHGLRGRRAPATVRAMTEQLWYPLWDAGFVTGHGARTVKDSVSLADDDLDALTALLEVRHIAGDESLTADLEQKVRELAERRRERVLPRARGRSRIATTAPRSGRGDARTRSEGRRRRAP